MNNQKVIEFLIYLVGTATIYIPFHYNVNSGKRPWARFDSIIGWGMLITLVVGIGYIVFASERLHSWITLSVALALTSGTTLSIWENPYSDRPLPLPYKIARWIAALGLLWAIGGTLQLY